MQSIPKDKILEHHPDTMIAIRKEYNLDKPGRIEDAIRILREWVQKQDHFIKKDFSDVYLETAIIVCKGSLERSKKQIDRMCTLRTLLPHFFEVRNPKTDLGNMFDVITPVVLPKLTPDHYRVFIVKLNKDSHILKDHFFYYVYTMMLGDYMKIHDYTRGFIIIIDFMEINVMEYLTNMNATLVRQAFTTLIDGYGMRIKGIHIYTPSKLIDAFAILLKQVVSSKVSDRIHTYKTLDNLADIVPSDILPADYGGKERPMKTIHAEWLEVLSSEEHLNYMKDLNRARTDESRRQTDKFNDEYAGMPGTFRVLTVD